MPISKIIRNHSSDSLTTMKLQNNIRGTILIWTVLLGVAMTSAFFFISMRLGGIGGIQRESIEYKNQEAYLESYADYLMKHPSEINATVDGIEIQLTQKADEIKGVLDAGGSVEYNFSGNINVYWNLCSNNNKETLVIEDTEHFHDTLLPSCLPASPGYDDGPTAITITASPFTIATKNAPINYKITPVAPTQLIDNIWHLKAAIDLGYGKKIEVERVFEPTL